MQALNGYLQVTQNAQPNAIISLMLRKRHVDEVARQNLELIVQACARRQGTARGGQIYLASLLGTPSTHLSAIRHGKRNLRDLKDRIERRLNLGPGWMDREHDESVVSEIVQRLPSRPRAQKTGIPQPAREYGELRNRLNEALERISALESERASKANTRK